jgi:hypothetical protein
MSWIERPSLPLAQFPAASGVEHADSGRSQRGSRDSRSRRLVLRLEPRADLMFISPDVYRDPSKASARVRSAGYIWKPFYPRWLPRSPCGGLNETPRRRLLAQCGIDVTGVGCVRLGSRNRTACLSRPNGRSCGARTLWRGSRPRACRWCGGSWTIRRCCLPWPIWWNRGARGLRRNNRRDRRCLSSILRCWCSCSGCRSRCGGGFDCLLLPILLLSATLLFSTTLVETSERRIDMPRRKVVFDHKILVYSLGQVRSLLYK